MGGGGFEALDIAPAFPTGSGQAKNRRGGVPGRVPVGRWATTFGAVTWETTSDPVPPENTADPAPTPAAPVDPEPGLNAEELRVLACLIEKSHTTPDQYPLSSNALTVACNQKTSRDPVVDYPAQLVDHTLQLLRDGGWARSKRAAGERTFKHRHVVEERLGLDGPEQALVAVLALRGPQSPGELKTRTERYHPFADQDEVEAVLHRLASRAEPLTRNIGRAAGQSQDRWIQLLGPTSGDDGSGEPVPGDGSVPAPPVPPAGPGQVEELRQRIALLEERMDRLERELGL